MLLARHQRVGDVLHEALTRLRVALVAAALGWRARLKTKHWIMNVMAQRGIV